MATAPVTGTQWLRRQATRVTEGEKLAVSAPVAVTVEVEAWLQEHGVRYAPPAAIPMQLIDERRSRGNQARKDPLVADSVDRFTAAMKSGATFPPIVVYPHGGKVVIIDGNNRQAAARKAGWESITGIVIAEDTPSETIQLLTVEANATHGVTPELSWRIQQAFHLCSLGFTDTAASKAAAVSVTQLRAARQVQEADQRAKALRILGFSDLANATRQALAAVKDDMVFFQLAKLAVVSRMTTEDVREVLRHLKTLRSESDRISYISEVAENRAVDQATAKAVGRASNRVNNPKHSLVTGIGKLTKINEADLIRQIVTSHDRDQVRKRVKEALVKLQMVELALTQLDDLED